jgi:hypothetical protein
MARPGSLSADPSRRDRGAPIHYVLESRPDRSRPDQSRPDPSRRIILTGNPAGPGRASRATGAEPAFKQGITRRRGDCAEIARRKFRSLRAKCQVLAFSAVLRAISAIAAWSLLLPSSRAAPVRPLQDTKPIGFIQRGSATGRRERARSFSPRSVPRGSISPGSIFPGGHHVMVPATRWRGTRGRARLTRSGRDHSWEPDDGIMPAGSRRLDEHPGTRRGDPST